MKILRKGLRIPYIFKKTIKQRVFHKGAMRPFEPKRMHCEMGQSKYENAFRDLLIQELDRTNLITPRRHTISKGLIAHSFSGSPAQEWHCDYPLGDEDDSKTILVAIENGTWIDFKNAGKFQLGTGDVVVFEGSRVHRESECDVPNTKLYFFADDMFCKREDNTIYH